MNVQFRESTEAASPLTVKTAIADCDIHPARATRTALYPYLAKRWQHHLEVYGVHAYQGMMAGPPPPVGAVRISDVRRTAVLLVDLHAEATARSQQRGTRRAQSAQHRAGHP